MRNADNLSQLSRILLVAVVAALCFGVYFVITRNSDSGDPLNITIIDSKTAEPFSGNVTINSSDGNVNCAEPPCDQPNEKRWSTSTNTEGQITVPARIVNSYMELNLDGVQSKPQLDFSNTDIPPALTVEFDSNDAIQPSDDKLLRRYKLVDKETGKPLNDTKIQLLNTDKEPIDTVTSNSLGNIFINARHCTRTGHKQWASFFTVKGYDSGGCSEGSGARGTDTAGNRTIFLTKE